MDRFDRDIVEMVLRWAPFGEVPADVAFTALGLEPIQLRERVERLLENEPPACRLPPRDAALLARVRAYRRASQAIVRSVVVQPHVPNAKPAGPRQEGGQRAMESFAPRTPREAAWSWQWSGRCRSEDPALFFPAEGERGAAAAARETRAKAVCAQCPVVNECREFSLRSGELFGVWGGLAERERRNLIGLPHARRRSITC